MLRFRSLLSSVILSGSLLFAAACGPQLDGAGDDDESADVHAAVAGTRYPILLLHGFNASPTSRWGFYGVAASLRAAGYSVTEAIVPPYNSVPVRARYLATQVDQVLRTSSAAKVNLIAHSMGGLDARYLVSSLGYGGRVASLTTISTPHRGSYVADIGLKLSPGFADDALNAIAQAWGETFSSVASDANMRAALLSLSESNAPSFNATNPNDSRVFYQSYAGVSSVLGIPNPKDDGACGGRWLTFGSADRMDATLVAGAAFVAHGTSLLPNDGMVMVSSAKWGTFQGCIAADHLDEVGQIKDSGTDPRTGFNHLSFYRSIAAGLQARGF